MKWCLNVHIARSAALYDALCDGCYICEVALSL
jgi:hypothetical protein